MRNLYCTLSHLCYNPKRLCSDGADFRREGEFRQEGVCKKMTKPKRKKAKAAISSKGVGKGQTKAAEYVAYLLELHKLQGTLLNRLDRQVR
jgi:hypothetical protein